MSLSRFLSGSSGSGRGAQVQATIRYRGLQATHLEQVKDKLKKHPEGIECSDDELEQLAFRLTEPKELFKYFTFTREDTGGAAAIEYAQEPLLGIQRASQQDRQRLADLPVKLILSKINDHGSKFATPIVKLFEMEYGPLHASLQVGDQILEWNTTSLVVPHGKVIRDVVKEATINEHMAPHRQLHEEEEVDLVFKKSAQKALQLEKLVGVITNYNRYWYYDPLKRNCHRFVCEASAAMGYENPPQLNSRLDEYLNKLKTNKKRAIPNYFETHETLDTYVLEKRVELSPIDKEYLVCHYFQFHIVSKTESKDPGSWQCEFPNCQSETLERQLDVQSLSLNNFRRSTQEATP